MADVSLTPTDQQAGGTSSASEADTAPGSAPGPSAVDDAPEHSYRPVTRADGQPGDWPWTPATSEDWGLASYDEGQDPG